MDKLVVRGGNPLTGDLHVSGSKNTALPLMAIGLLTNGPVTISHVPDLKDISTFRKVIEVTGTTVTGSPSDHQLVIDASNLNRPEAPTSS